MFLAIRSSSFSCLYLVLNHCPDGIVGQSHFSLAFLQDIPTGPPVITGQLRWHNNNRPSWPLIQLLLLTNCLREIDSIQSYCSMICLAHASAQILSLLWRFVVLSFSCSCLIPLILGLFVDGSQGICKGETRLDMPSWFFYIQPATNSIDNFSPFLCSFSSSISQVFPHWSIWWTASVNPISAPSSHRWTFPVQRFLHGEPWPVPLPATIPRADPPKFFVVSVWDCTWCCVLANPNFNWWMLDINCDVGCSRNLRSTSMIYFACCSSWAAFACWAHASSATLRASSARDSALTMFSCIVCTAACRSCTSSSRPALL